MEILKFDIPAASMINCPTNGDRSGVYALDAEHIPTLDLGCICAPCVIAFKLKSR